MVGSVKWVCTFNEGRRASPGDDFAVGTLMAGGSSFIPGDLARLADSRNQCLSAAN